tara:strand:- start:419 stop:595 length:177 start_codon:yes stop_codon:yes gene_type:complete
MDKETLLRLAQPAATALLALSICSLPLTVKAYSDSVSIRGSVEVKPYYSSGFKIKGCD